MKLLSFNFHIFKRRIQNFPSAVIEFRNNVWTLRGVWFVRTLFWQKIPLCLLVESFMKLLHLFLYKIIISESVSIKIDLFKKQHIQFSMLKKNFSFQLNSIFYDFFELQKFFKFWKILFCLNFRFNTSETNKQIKIRSWKMNLKNIYRFTNP